LINIVVFASGSGTNFQSIIDAIEDGKINGRICGLITNKKDIQSIERARKHDIPHVTISPSDFDNQADYIDALITRLTNWETDLIVLAGYMLKIPSAVIENYEGKIINIHPSLLPKYGGKGFYGIKVHQAVLENEEQESGCTVHIVTEEYDEGPILAQRKVPVYDTDDAEQLAERVLKQEHQLLPEVIAELANKHHSKNN
jgi:formyltetrahydrofolate-dependent phosphoribosylglycinamide formyltransferase